MRQVPINDLSRVYDRYGDRIERQIKKVLRSGRWLNGQQTEEFCHTFASLVGVSHCIGVGNGTDALELSLRAILSMDPRFCSYSTGTNSAEVVTVANAGGYTTTACYLNSCVPVYADVEPHSQLMSISSAVAAISERTAVVVVTHLYGGLVDVPSLRHLMDSAGYGGIPILEDCAQAHGLVGCGGNAGAFGNIATYSFYPTKNLGAVGDAGAVLTNDDGLADRVRQLQQYGWREKYRVKVALGCNSRLDEIQAATLLVLLQDLESANERRRRILGLYENAVTASNRFARSEFGTVAHLAVLMAEDRKSTRRHLNNRGIATEVHYPVLDCHQLGWRDLEWRCSPTGIPVSEASVQCILSVPCFPLMTDDEIGLVCEALSSYAAQHE